MDFDPNFPSGLWLTFVPRWPDGLHVRKHKEEDLSVLDLPLVDTSPATCSHMSVADVSTELARLSWSWGRNLDCILISGVEDSRRMKVRMCSGVLNVHIISYIKIFYQARADRGLLTN